MALAAIATVPRVAANALARAAHAWLAGTPELPPPGAGDTRERWRELESIAAADVCLAKVLEAHHDALAIFEELAEPIDAAGQLWAVWAAEPPGLALTFEPGANGDGVLSGEKAWCSGADIVTHALVTATMAGERVLVKVALDARGISPPATAWNAVGMSRIVSGGLQFSGVRARLVGAPGAYLARPGFWHGGAGIAACWYGAATAIAQTLRRSARIAGNPHAAAHLGAIHMQLAAARALLRELAETIDLEPTQSHADAVTTARSFVERVCVDTIDRVGRALGPGPLCEDLAHAQRCADLTTFIRQSHAERDWQALGVAIAAEDAPWTL